MTAFYNEIDPYAAQWLRNLIAAGHIAPGVVDERPIQEIEAYELVEFTQCHFFAGIGIWSHALRRAGWSDDRPIWTGSCPCQPFSNAGQKKGFQDDRHLWPYWKKLIDECRPSVVIGEQVASALDWVDLVSADMEGSGYAFGANDLCAAGFGGAHIRQRIYFVGLDNLPSARCFRPVEQSKSETWGEARLRLLSAGCSNGGMADDDDARPQGHRQSRQFDAEGGRQDAARHDTALGASSGMADDGCTIVQSRKQFGDDKSSSGEIEAEAWEFEWRRTRDSNGSTASGMVDTDGGNACAKRQQSGRKYGQQQEDGSPLPAGRADAPMLGRQAVDWLYCRDGKWRPVEPGTFPLVDETPARVGRLRAYGNGLDAETATEFCGTVREICDEAGI